MSLPSRVLAFSRGIRSPLSRWPSIARAADGKLLRWSPPEQENPEIYEVPTGTTFASKTFGAGVDGIVKLPASVRKRGIEIKGGRHVRIIGGEIDFTGGNSTGPSIRCTQQTGSIFIEGIKINVANAEQDAVDFGGSATSPFTLFPNVYLQNCLIEGVNGNFEAFHGDAFQVQASMKNFYVDKVTIKSSYQGAFIPAQKPVEAGYFSRLNSAFGTESKGYQLWFLSEGTGTNEFGTPKCNPYPIVLDQVYADPGTSGKSFMTQLVFPKEGAGEGEINGVLKVIAGFTTDGGLSIEWPAATLITGKVIKGPPPAGDFCKSSECGLGYVPVGYR